MENRQALVLEMERERIQKKHRLHGIACPSCTKKLLRCHSFGVPTNIDSLQRYQPRTTNRSFCNAHKKLVPIAPSQPMPSTYPSLLGSGSPYTYFPPGWMMLPPRNNGFRTNEGKFRMLQHALRPYYNWLAVPGPPEVISVSDDSVGSSQMKCDEKEIDLNRTPDEIKEKEEYDSKPARGELDLNVKQAEPEEDIDLRLKL